MCTHELHERVTERWGRRWEYHPANHRANHGAPGRSPRAGGVPAPGGGGVHEPCGTIVKLRPASDQSAPTALATTSVAVTLELVRRRGRGASLQTTLRSVSPSGAVVGTAVSPVLTIGSNPQSLTLTTDNMAFGTTFSEVVNLVNAKTGVQDASGPVPVTTPSSRHRDA